MLAASNVLDVAHDWLKIIFLNCTVLLLTRARQVTKRPVPPSRLTSFIWAQNLMSDATC